MKVILKEDMSNLGVAGDVVAGRAQGEGLDAGGGEVDDPVVPRPGPGVLVALLGEVGDPGGGGEDLDGEQRRRHEPVLRGLRGGDHDDVRLPHGE